MAARTHLPASVIATAAARAPHAAAHGVDPRGLSGFGAGLRERRQAGPAWLERRLGGSLRRFRRRLRLLVRAEDRCFGLAREQALELVGLDRLAAQQDL